MTLINSHPQRSDYDTYFTPNYAPADFIPVSGKGARVIDQNGRDYIDFGSGIAVCTLGHCHDIMVRALTEQANKMWHISNLMINEPIIKTAKLLIENTFADKVIFTNSGAEANESALKMARRWAFDNYGADKNEIIAFDDAFHGRTFFTVCVGGQPKYSDGFGPKPAGITHLPYNDVDAFKNAISDKTCAVIVEPVQGEGGVNPATPEFMQTIRDLCTQHNVALILDEVQTGVARTGAFYAYMHYGIEPDIMTTAKGLGGGFPISACLAKAQFADHLTVGTHGTTYGGNPLGGAVANAVLEHVLADGFMDHVNAMAGVLETFLQSMVDKYPDVFASVRGMGLLRGIVLSDAWAGRSREFVIEGQNQGLMILVAGPHVVRFAPPLSVTPEELDEGLARFAKVADTVIS